MTFKKSLENRIRGWFPQEPKMGVTRTSNINMEPTWRVSAPFLASGVLLIVAAALSAFFGFYLLASYRNSMLNSRFVSTDIPGLFLGIFNFIAFGVDLFAAMLLLLRRHVGLAVILLGVVLAFGISAPFVTNFVNQTHISIIDYPKFIVLQEVIWSGLLGLLPALPMIAFSIPALIVTWRSQRKRQESFGQWPKFSFAFAGVLMVAAAVLSAYSGLEILFGNNAFVFTHASWSYYAPAVTAILDFVICPVAILAGVWLLKRKQTRLAVASTAAVFGLMVAVTAVSGFVPFDTLVFGTYAYVASITTLTLVALNYRKLEQGINMKGLQIQGAQ